MLFVKSNQHNFSYSKMTLTLTSYGSLEISRSFPCPLQGCMNRGKKGDLSHYKKMLTSLYVKGLAFTVNAKEQNLNHFAFNRPIPLLKMPKELCIKHIHIARTSIHYTIYSS